jgi:hypothetical protein
MALLTPKLFPAIALNASNYVPISFPSGTAISALIIQCRTAVDVLISDTPSPDDGEYWTLKSGNALPIDMDGNMSNADTSSDYLTNGTFTSNADGWTMDLLDWTYAGNAVSKDEDGVTTLSQVPATAIAVGDIFQLIYTLSGAGFVASVTPSVGGQNGAARSAAGTYTDYIKAEDTTSGLIFTPSNLSRFTIDTITLKKVTKCKLWAKSSAGTVYLELMILQ